jgi:outer membrane protein assembly factor BamB
MRLKEFKRVVFCGILFLAVVNTLRADADNGTNQLWRLRLPDDNTLSSCALAPDGTIYQGMHRGRMMAVTPDGKIKWIYKVGREILSSPAVADDGTVYFGSRDRSFYALTPEGKLKWSFATGAWVDSSPAIATDGTVYFGSWDRKFYAVTPDGKLKWSFATSNVITTSPALANDGTIYFGSHDRNFYALTPEGRVKWKFTTGAEIDSSAAIGPDGMIYFGSTDGNLYALNPDGSEHWRYHTGSITASQPVLDTQGNLYLAANKEHIAVSPEGKLLWYHPTDILMDLTWAVAANGSIYASIPWLRVGAMDPKTVWPPVWAFGMHFNLNTAPNVSPEGIVYACDSYYLYAICPTNAAPLAKSSWPMWRANPQHTGRVQP